MFLINNLKFEMVKTFEMSNLGVLHYFLGLQVKQDQAGIFISQKNYAKNILKKFNMLHCKTTITPMNVGEKLQLNDGSREADTKTYRSLVGGLIYLTHTRPNISFPVGVASRYMNTPQNNILEPPDVY